MVTRTHFVWYFKTLLFIHRMAHKYLKILFKIVTRLVHVTISKFMPSLSML